MQPLALKSFKKAFSCTKLNVLLYCENIYQVNVVPSSPVLGENVQQGEGDGEVAHEEPRDGQVSDEDVLSGQSHL